jgi:hypothetical protein
MSSKILKLGTFAIPKVGANKLMGYKPPFFPTDLENCIVWLDNQETDFIKSGSDKVSQWTDKSGLNNHYTQGTGALQPLFVANGINGQNGVYFSNSADNYLERNLGATYPQPFTIITVWNLDATSTGSSPVVYDNMPAVGLRVALYWTGNQVGVAGSTFTNAYAKTRPFGLVQNMVEHNGASTRVFENGTLKNTVSAGTSSLSSFRLGHLSSVGSANRLAGYVCEKIVYSRTLTSGEQAQINTYLNNKYGI